MKAVTLAFIVQIAVFPRLVEDFNLIYVMKTITIVHLFYFPVLLAFLDTFMFNVLQYYDK